MILAKRPQSSYQKNRFKGGLHGIIFMKINTIFNTHMLF